MAIDKKPTINSNQFIVGHAEYATGHILNNTLTDYCEGSNTYLVFDSEQKAITYIRQTIEKNQSIECWLENSLGKHLLTLDKNGKRSAKSD